MSKRWQLFRRRRTYLVAILILLVLGLAFVGLESTQSKNQARRLFVRSISEPGNRLSVDGMVWRFGTQACVNALTDLLTIRPSPWASWYDKAYQQMPKMIKGRLPKPVDRMEVLGTSIEALGRFGPAAAPAVPALGRIYQSGDAALVKKRRPVLQTLRRIGPLAGEVIPALLPDLNPGPMQEFVAETLIRIDPNGDRVGQAMLALIRQPGYERFASNVAASCVIALEPPSPAGSTSASEKPMYPSRWTAFLVAGLVRSEAKQTVPILRGYLDDESGVIRGLAATSFGLLGPSAAEALPDLRRCLTDDWSSVREAATNAVRSIEGEPGNSYTSGFGRTGG